MIEVGGHEREFLLTGGSGNPKVVGPDQIALTAQNARDLRVVHGCSPCDRKDLEGFDNGKKPRLAQILKSLGVFSIRNDGEEGSFFGMTLEKAMGPSRLALLTLPLKVDQKGRVKD